MTDFRVESGVSIPIADARYLKLDCSNDPLTETLELNKNLTLQDTTTSTTGVVMKGANRFIHDFHHPTGSTAVPTGQNTFVGEGAGNFTMGSTATETYHGSYNTGVGYQALQANTTGFYNTANGVSALYSNTTGNYNTANGVSALRLNTTGYANTACGTYALYSNKTGYNGVAIGYYSQQYANDTAVAWINYNTSVGYQALRGSTTAANNKGNYNTALGYRTLLNTTSGSVNTAIGYSTLSVNTTGVSNVAIGGTALATNITGSYNVAVGHQAGRFIADGVTANTTSDYSVYLGQNTFASADNAQNEIVIGYNAIGQGSNTIVFGNTSMVGAYFLADNYKTYWGAGRDASIYYDATNLIVNPREVGTGFMRYSSAINRRYYHLLVDAFNPGASGATFTPPSANTIGGYQINTATEFLYFESDVHSDWDGASDLTVEITFEVNIDNTGGGAGDTVDLKLQGFAKGNGETACKTLSIAEVATVVGASAQYKQFKATFTIDYDAGGAVVEVGDKIGFILNIETDSSEVDDIIVADGSFFYNTTHLSIESGDT